MWHLQSHWSHSPLQYGCRTARSVLDLLYEFDYFIRSGFSLRKTVIVVVFDVEKAYDTTW